jgi:hypothetical protein
MDSQTGREMETDLIRTNFCKPNGLLLKRKRKPIESRDENGRKRSVNTKTITVFIFFIGNKIGNGNSGNGNDIGISEKSETKVRCGKYTGNGRNLNTIGKHIKLHNTTKLTKDHKDHQFKIHDITSSQYNKFTRITNL